MTSRLPGVVVGAVIAALAGASILITRRLKATREELRICQQDFLVLEGKWSECRKELRTARMLE